ncbi:MAG: trehalose-6-phosphate synthase [Actinomycetota bacterium]|nr:trehalose-6-phosphate synthase [Actinomycetota bacterium]
MSSERSERDDATDRVERPIVAVANRLPVTKSKGKWQVSMGGLVTALRPVMERQDGMWVGWDGGDEDVPSRVEGLDIELRSLSLTNAQLQGYYYGFANRTIWPLFHDLVEQPVFERGWWKTYDEVNHTFAETTEDLEFDHEAPLLWVHDYHLMVLPKLLRERHPASPIAFFLHIPVPPPELFARLPWREEILEGLLGADVVAFHTERYRDNFTRAVERLHPKRTAIDGRTIVLPDGRRVRTAAHPISVDSRRFAELARSEEVGGELEALREQFSGRKVILGCDRLDYTKGIHERFKAIELLLERRSDLRAKLAFVQIAVPSREGVQEYRELRRDVERTVGRINGRFTEPGQDVPVYYLHRGVPQPRLVAFYQLADVAVVTPLKDGMNLIAKEFVVSQDAVDGTGVLVLSEFTGAALELPDAISCNPFDVEGLSGRIEQALETDGEEWRPRLKRMASNVHEHDIFHWVDRELAEVEEVTAES